MKLTNTDKKRLFNSYGEWALVTGATSGIGRQIAILLASAGFNIVINARNENALLSLSKELEKSYQVKVKIACFDLATEDGVKKLIATCNEVNIGLLVASAGFGTSGTFITSSVQNEQNMLRVNCEAVLLLTHHFGKVFTSQQRGGIILLSSIVGFQGVPYAAHYAATKAYIQALAEGIYHELKPFGVDVLAAAPGPVKSGFGERADMNMKVALTTQQVAVPILKALGKRATVFPGALTKLLVYSLRTVPRSIKVLIMKQVMKGMTQHQY
ncbi:MAG: SDR family NAD(P)-dependent oxidoreductase [Bacteroidota bacterium]